MGSHTWGTGTDIFAVDYIDAQIPESGNSQWKTADAKNHTLTAVELKNLTGYYEAGSDTATSHISDTNTPFNRGTDGASAGYYRTLYYTSKTKDDYFFTQNVLMYDRHIITNVSDIQRLLWKPTVTKTTQTVTLIDGTSKEITIYSVSSFQSNRIDILKKNNPEQTTATDINIISALISPTVENSLQNFPYWNRDSEGITWVDGNVKRYAQTYGTGSNNVPRYTPFISDNKLIFPNSDNETTRYVVDKSGKYILSVTYRAGDKYSYMTNMYANARYYVIDEDEFLHILSRSGLKFVYENVIYKPVADNGVIIGYTSDMTKTSEWDNWHDYTDHIVPVTPPTPSGGDGDQLNEMLSRGQFYGSGLMTYYVNPPESKLQKALGSWDNISTGKDVIQNLVSFKALCFPSSTFTSGVLHDFTIAGVTLKDEQENAIQAATVTKMGGVYLPSITIPKTFNDFRDYAPYTKLSMYVPLCGWFELPSWCIGRTINGEMYINPYGGTVKCIVRADGNVVAELGGNAAIDLPFNATAVGMKTAAVLSNIMSTAGATARAIMLPSPNTIAGVGSSALGLICSLNANYTESKGVMGDSSNITGLYSVYIKISRPSTIDSNGNDIKTIPETYKHENGLPCNKQLELQSGDGYTQVLDLNITGSMTATEKQMIEEGFRHGLIL